MKPLSIQTEFQQPVGDVNSFSPYTSYTAMLNNPIGSANPLKSANSNTSMDDLYNLPQNDDASGLNFNSQFPNSSSFNAGGSKSSPLFSEFSQITNNAPAQEMSASQLLATLNSMPIEHKRILISGGVPANMSQVC